jgi:Glyoxalase-like domain
MRLDHVSYAASHDQISDVVNRIGSQIGTAFVDGGIHPKFGTRNFTAPLLNGQYIEVVCPLDHPATDVTPFGQAVKTKADAGGGWMAWVLSTEKIDQLENYLERKSIRGLRKKPDGSTLEWKQIGVLDLMLDPCLPYYIEWMTKDHPSQDGKSNVGISRINLVVSPRFNQIPFVTEIKKLNQISIENETISDAGEFTGINAVEFTSSNGSVVID